jgi:hypothetical protein
VRNEDQHEYSIYHGSVAHLTESEAVALNTGRNDEGVSSYMPLWAIGDDTLTLDQVARRVENLGTGCGPKRRSR